MTDKGFKKFKHFSEPFGSQFFAAGTKRWKKLGNLLDAVRLFVYVLLVNCILTSTCTYTEILIYCLHIFRSVLKLDIVRSHYSPNSLKATAQSGCTHVHYSHQALGYKRVILKDAGTTGQTTGQSDGDGDSDTTGHRQDDGTRRRDSVICCRACDGTDAGTDRRTQRQTSCVVISEKSQDVVTHAGTDLRRWGRLRERRRVVISERPSTVDPAVAEGPRDARAS